MRVDTFENGVMVHLHQKLGQDSATFNFIIRLKTVYLWVIGVNFGKNISFFEL